ncbi:MAG: hypothetical protein WC365_09995 [Candidatus Babeliales bacterium]
MKVIEHEEQRNILTDWIERRRPKNTTMEYIDREWQKIKYSMGIYRMIDLELYMSAYGGMFWGQGDHTVTYLINSGMDNVYGY